MIKMHEAKPRILVVNAPLLDRSLPKPTERVHLTIVIRPEYGVPWEFKVILPYRCVEYRLRGDEEVKVVSTHDYIDTCRVQQRAVRKIIYIYIYIFALLNHVYRVMIYIQIVIFAQ
jgi:hypothetical protein